TSDHSILVVVPLHFIHGRMQLLTHALIGGTVVFSAGFHFPERIIEELAHYGVTGFSGVPYHFLTLLQHTSLGATALPCLRYVLITGGALPTNALQKLSDALPGVAVHIAYGLTEASPRVSHLRPLEALSRVGSCGLPLPGVKVEIVSDKGSILQAGRVG